MGDGQVFTSVVLAGMIKHFSCGDLSPLPDTVMRMVRFLRGSRIIRCKCIDKSKTLYCLESVGRLRDENWEELVEQAASSFPKCLA